MVITGLEQNDWRIQGQGSYLARRSFKLQLFSPDEQASDHEHCEFCSGKISMLDNSEHEGYVTLDGVFWICKTCFQDFRDMYQFNLFDAQRYHNKTFLQILDMESTVLAHHQGLYPIKRLVALCHNLDCSIAPSTFTLLPCLVSLMPQSVHVFPLKSNEETIHSASATDIGKKLTSLYSKLNKHHTSPIAKDSSNRNCLVLCGILEDKGMVLSSSP